MTYFEDLTPYTYLQPEDEEPNTVNIGWLDPAHDFPTGVTTEEFQAKLELLCMRQVKRTRGFLHCPFCQGLERSSSEMRVAHGGKVYAAPSLVHHYVVAHAYRPPDEFIAAVLASGGSGLGRFPLFVGLPPRRWVGIQTVSTLLVELMAQVGAG